MHAVMSEGAGDSGVPDRVQVIEAEVARLSGLLNQLMSGNDARLEVTRPIMEAPRPVPMPRPLPSPVSFDRARARMVREIIRHRRKREIQFPSYLLADPGWDMLLDLYAAHYEGNPVSVSSLCIAAAVPATTALRWIKTMEEEGHFTRSQDPYDGRRIYIAISAEARARMDEYFDDIAS